MSHDPGAEGLHEFSLSRCGLVALRKRSQVDFEIDFFERVLSRDPNYTEVLLNLGELFALKGWKRRALQVDQRLAQLRPHDPVVAYNLACSHALLHHTHEALEALRHAIAAGYDDLAYLQSDPDLAGLRLHPDYQRLVGQLEHQVSRVI